ncbi:MAG TPA: hypothetical protein VEZ89_07925 [Rubrivivax sp.]|nr:hypothetical protein [Rubrivivax sp.]
MKLHSALVACSILALTGLAHAQQTPDASKPNPSAATSTGTSTSQSEMNRGAPGVNVDVGRSASNGVVSGSVDRNTDARNTTNTNRSNRGADATSDQSGTGMRAARADRG